MASQNTKYVRLKERNPKKSLTTKVYSFDGVHYDAGGKWRPATEELSRKLGRMRAEDNPDLPLMFEVRTKAEVESGKYGDFIPDEPEDFELDLGDREVDENGDPIALEPAGVDVKDQLGPGTPGNGPAASPAAAILGSSSKTKDDPAAGTDLAGAKSNKKAPGAP